MSIKRYINKVFHWWWLLKRPMTTGVRVLARDVSGKVVLVRHTYVDGWYLPGGGVERGETFEEAVRKELIEETGYQIIGELELKSIHYNKNASPRDHVAVFHCAEIEKVNEFKPNREIAEIGLFDMNDLPLEATEATRRRVLEALGAQKPSPYW